MILIHFINHTLVILITHLEETGCLQGFLDVVFGDVYFTRVCVVQQHLHVLCINPLNVHTLFTFLSQVCTEHGSENQETSRTHTSALITVH